MIVPSVGRVVWYWQGWGQQDQPLAAIVTYVHNDHKVNLCVFDKTGYSIGKFDVPLIQEGEAAPPGGQYAEWMPYQKSVAKGEIPPVLHAEPPSAG